MPQFLEEWFARFGDIPVIVVLLGLLGQLVFSARFIVQWLASEKAKRSVVPVSFWWISIAGAALLLTYAILRADPIFILGQSLGFIIYTRNLALIRRERSAGPPSTPTPSSST